MLVVRSKEYPAYYREKSRRYCASLRELAYMLDCEAEAWKLTRLYCREVRFSIMALRARYVLHALRLTFIDSSQVKTPQPVYS